MNVDQEWIAVCLKQSGDKISEQETNYGLSFLCVCLICSFLMVCSSRTIFLVVCSFLMVCSSRTIFLVTGALTLVFWAGTCGALCDQQPGFWRQKQPHRSLSACPSRDGRWVNRWARWALALVTSRILDPGFRTPIRGFLEPLHRLLWAARYLQTRTMVPIKEINCIHEHSCFIGNLPYIVPPAISAGKKGVQETIGPRYEHHGHFSPLSWSKKDSNERGKN